MHQTTKQKLNPTEEEGFLGSFEFTFFFSNVKANKLLEKMDLQNQKEEEK